MRTCETAGVLLLTALCCVAYAADPGLGRSATSAEIAAIDISIPPSGEGLPRGSGDAIAGERVYLAKCVACHGEGAQGKPADPLVGGIGSLATGNPVKSIGSYWPYATTLFDYIRRAMPLDAPMSLSNDEVYALTAYLLMLNDVVPEHLSLDAVSLPNVRMPNRDGFIDRADVRP